MPILISCTTKGCGETAEALIDKQTMEVYCSECGGAIKGISSFMKNSLLQAGQVKRVNTQEAFSLKCPKCEKQTIPLLKNDLIVCQVCKESMNDGLTHVFVNMLREQLKSNQ